MFPSFPTMGCDVNKFLIQEGKESNKQIIYLVGIFYFLQ